MTGQRVALYLQDAHSLQDGIKIAQYAESKGFERHVDLARQLNVRVEVCQLQSLALDVDVPDDFELYQMGTQVNK